MRPINPFWTIGSENNFIIRFKEEFGMRHTILYPQHAMLDDMITQFFGDAFNNQKANSKYPLTDVYDEDGIAYMEIAVAGFSKDEIKVTVDANTLTVKGESAKKDTSNRNYIKKDIAKRNFEKSYSLMFDVESVDAEINDGILKIKLVPFIPEETKPKQIEIK